MSKEQAVREAAKQLGAAIAAAEAAGYRVTWPANAGGLASIGISETARVAPAPEPELRQLAELPPQPEPDPVPAETPSPTRRARRG